MTQSLGKITGRTSTSSFDFLVEGDVKKWDYITFEHLEVGKVLAQVRELLKKNSETLANCDIIGYRTERGFLRRPRTPPEPKAEIGPAHDDFLKQILGLKQQGLYLGLLEGKDNLKAFIDPKKLITQHLAVLAKSGAGKSYALGVLLEELAEMKVPVVIVDPHGEYSSIKSANKHTDDEKYFKTYGISPKAYRSQVREFAVNTSINMDAEQLRLPIPQTASTLIESLPFKITNTQKGLLYNAIDELRKKKSKFRFSDVVEELEFAESASKWNLITGLRNLANTRLFSFEPTSADSIVKQGQLTIINLKGASPDMQQMVAQALASILFEMRKTNQLPPFFMIIEEAHNFCPERGFGEAQSSRIIRTIASEGRKFGLGIAIVSQRSARVDKSVLSQTGSQIILQVTNPNDLKAVSHSFEGVSSETEDEIKNLPIGKALVIGAADYPLFVDVRVRRSQHGGRAQTFKFAEMPAQSAHSSSKTASPQLETPSSGQLAYGLASERSEQSLTLAFPPKIMPKDIILMEKEEVKNAKLVLRPCYSVQASGAHLVIDATEPAVYSFTDKLSRTKIPEFAGKLSPDQRKLISAAAVSKTITEVYSKSGLSFSSVSSMVKTLVSKGMMKTDGKNIALHPDLRKIGELASSRFSLKPEFVDLPGEKLDSKISEREVSQTLKSLGIDAVSIQKCYIPFYNVELKKGKSKLVDALSYSLEL